MEIPRAIGKYEILERIGKGGFGVVYKGRDPFIKRLVAIKVCTSADETLRRRFLREAEIAGNLHHRNVVTVFEFGYDDAGPFLVQEYLDGEDLEPKIRRLEPIPWDLRLGYLLQIARALEYAHKKGILHRDVKPSNVRVLPDDRVKILDFGIAKLSGAETQLTRSGRILGTAGYLSPEQIKGEPVDARSDVFSFGVLAYELLSYVHPFPGTTLSELLHQVVRSDPDPLASVCPACPPEIAALVTRCMEKDPARRYEGFPQVAEELASILTGLRGGDGEEVGEAKEETASEGSGTPTSAMPASRHPPPGARGTSPAVPPASPEETLFRPVTDQAPMPAQAARDSAHEVQATREIPVDSARRSGQGQRWTVAAAVLAGCVLVALLAVWIGWRRLAAPAERAPEPSSRPVETITAPVASRLVVEAAPWGEVARVLDARRREVPLPPDRSTPLVLELPAGSYTVVLTHPEAADPASCSVELAGGETARCDVELHRLDAGEYFGQAGWWR